MCSFLVAYVLNMKESVCVTEMIKNFALFCSFCFSPACIICVICIVSDHCIEANC